jgi:phosphatidylserine/phosphatidylglycerophosphate/cardiolipin synthase-like enzyme
VQLVSREGRQHLNRIIDLADQHLLICSPFITTVEMSRVIEKLRAKADFNAMSVDVMTDMRPESVLAGSLHVQALLDLLDAGCQVKITTLARIHAKVYVADTNVAWITSANITTAGLEHNLEYGVLINDPSVAANILQEMREYGQLGTVATRFQVQNYVTAIEALRKDYEMYRRTSETRFRQQFRERLE